MRFKIQFLVLVVVAGILSTLFHVFGHCISYWLQGIPSGMSLIHEYPLRGITSRQYAIGSVGGPLVNFLLLIASFYIVQNLKKDSFVWLLFSASVISNSIYFFLRGIEAITRGAGGDIGKISSVTGVNYFIIISICLILTTLILFLWIRRFEIAISLRNGFYFFFLIISFIISQQVLFSIDSHFFRDRIPSLKIISDMS